MARALRRIGQTLCDSQVPQPCRVPPNARKHPFEQGGAHTDGKVVVPLSHIEAGEAQPGKADAAWDWCSDDADKESSLPAVRALPERAKISASMSTRLDVDRGPVGRAATPTSVSTEASNILKTDVQSESCETDRDCLCIPLDATLPEGVRLLVLHHLGRGIGDFADMTPSQRQLFERHVHQLAGYAERLKQTVLNSMMVADHARSMPHEHLDQDASTTSASSAAAPRHLRLKDTELLEIYHLAQQEAKKEADWRGLPQGGESGESHAWRYEWLRDLSHGPDRGGGPCQFPNKSALGFW